MTTPEEIIAQVDAWRDRQNIAIYPQPGGKTNHNFLIDVDGERFVLRISGQNTAALGIQRATERAAIVAAASIGVAPEVVAFILPEGHLITRFIHGAEWSPEEFKQPAVIARVAATMRQVHTLPPISGIFDPYRDITERLETARQRQITLPTRLPEFLQHMYAVKARRAAVLAGALKLCHNDPWHNNFLDDGAVRLLDWEFAGMGDPFFDLGSIAAFFSPEQKTALLRAYAGEVQPGELQSLEEMIFVVMFWNATWALLQIGVEYNEIDYAPMAARMFSFMERLMDNSTNLNK